ncbi:Leukocyte receptor cluster member 1 [Linnemannia zychae]|nr:Leukocyte receptor cluster member 1 [Linnemannia zychae]
MNILPHKSWHVYNQKNQDRVKKDEAKAEAEEKQIQERAIAADREHRLAVLRQRAARRYTNDPGLGGDGDEGEAQAGTVAPGLDDTMAVDTVSKKGNPEYEAEVKAKEKKWERTIAMHLDSASRGPTPWYTTPTTGSVASTSTKYVIEHA